MSTTPVLTVHSPDQKNITGDVRSILQQIGLTIPNDIAVDNVSPDHVRIMFRSPDPEMTGRARSELTRHGLQVSEGL